MPGINSKGQAVLAEHVMIFFVVVAALVAMTTYVQRAFEARIHDARDFMVNAVINSSVCDSNCMAATGGNIFYEYEPYYVQELSDVNSLSKDKLGATTGSPSELGAVYIKSVNEATQTVATSVQLPPECADGVSPKPSFCP